MSSDLKKLFGGNVRVREGVLPKGRGKKKKKQDPASPPISVSAPIVEQQPAPGEPGESDDVEEKGFAAMFDEPDEKPVNFSQAVDATLQDDDFGALAEKKNESENARQGKVYYNNPQEDLDLHGMTAAQAELRVEAFVMDAHRRKLVAIRIITGKGRHSPRGAVLPEIVATTLKKLKERGLVAAVRHEKKGGAVRVYLAE